VSRYQKVKTNLDLLKQETMMGGSGISWVICKLLPRSRHKPHHYPNTDYCSCHPVNSSEINVVSSRYYYSVYVVVAASGEDGGAILAAAHAA